MRLKPDLEAPMLYRDGLLLPVALLLAVVGSAACRREAQPEARKEEGRSPTSTPAEKGQGAGSPAREAQTAEAPVAPASPSSASKPPPRPAPSAPSVSQPVESKPAPAGSPATDVPKPAAPAPAPPRVIREVTIPEGAILELELLTAMDTAVSRVGDEIEAKTLSPVRVQGEVVLPKGTLVEGRVRDVESSGRVKGRAKLAFTFDRVATRSGSKKIAASFVEREAADGHKKDATVIGGAAGVGAIIGGIVGGKKGAAIGATIGGASGTGVVLATKGREIQLPVGTEVNVRLDQPLVVAVN